MYCSTHTYTHTCPHSTTHIGTNGNAHYHYYHGAYTRTISDANHDAADCGVS